MQGRLAQVLPAETLGRKRGRAGLVRSSVLLALGAMTIAVPLDGFLRPDLFNFYSFTSVRQQLVLIVGLTVLKPSLSSGLQCAG